MEFSEVHLQFLSLNEQLRMAQQIGHIGSWELRLSDDHLAWSEETCRIFGVNNEAFPRNFEAFLRFVHPDDRNGLLDVHNKTVHDGGDLNIEFRIVRPDGVNRCVRAHAKVAIDGAGERFLTGMVQDITEQKENQQVLRKNDILLEMAGRIAHVSGWEIELSSSLVTWSNKISHVLGIAPISPVTVEEAIGFFAPDYRSRIGKALEACMRDGTPFDEEMEVITPQGASLWVRVMGQAVRDHFNVITRLQGAIQDITDKKQSEQQAMALANRLATTLESITDAFFTLDREWRFTYVNREAEQLLERERKELLGKVVWAEFPDAVGTNFYRQYHRAVQEGCAVTFEEFYSQLGKWFEVHAYPSEDGLAIYFRDITKAKETEQRLRDQAALLDKAQDAIIVRDIDNRIQFWNKSAERLYGWTREEALGKSIDKLLDDDPVALKQAMDVLMAYGDWSGEVTRKAKNGNALTIEARWTLVRDDHGKPKSILSINTDVTQRKAADREIQQLAFYDSLTQLPNRALMHDRLQHALASSSRGRRAGAVLFIDLDNFKAINDTHGHDKGDLLLKQVAGRLKACVYECDTLARFGGDEFVALVENLSANRHEAVIQIRAVAERILATLGRPYLVDGTEHMSTASIGVAIFGDQATTVAELMKQADLAMYQAKALGRNTLRFFDPAMQDEMNARVALEADMRLALQRAEFLLYYQPQLNCAGNIVGAEALVRWRHPARGLVSPAAFISLAEETGLILPLGQWVLESACAQLAGWAPHPAMAGLSIAVNISARQLHHPEFVDNVLAVLAQTGIDPRKLKMELTESQLMVNVELAVTRILALRAKGVGFALDDFGTGYSSLSYLKRLPMDQLKIDQSFIRDVLNDPNDAAIVRTIIGLGQSLGLEVVAEGVETQEQKEFLDERGCPAYQGYYFSKPLPAQDFQSFVLARVQSKADDATP